MGFLVVHLASTGADEQRKSKARPPKPRARHPGLFRVDRRGREIPHIRKPTASQERGGKKKRRLAPFGMTDGCDRLGRDAAEAEVFDFDEFVDAVFGAFAAEAGFFMLVLPASQMGSGQAQFVMGAVAL